MLVLFVLGVNSKLYPYILTSTYILIYIYTLYMHIYAYTLYIHNTYTLHIPIYTHNLHNPPRYILSLAHFIDEETDWERSHSWAMGISRMGFAEALGRVSCHEVKNRKHVHRQFSSANRSRYPTAAGIRLPNSSDWSHSEDTGIHQSISLRKMQLVEKIPVLKINAASRW